MHDDIYKQNILDHYKYPHNKGVLEGCSVSQDGANPSCGDTVVLYLDIKDNVIRDVSFDGDGCAISQAATSMLTDKIKGMSLQDVKLLTPGDIYTMLGVTISPGRVKCALLSYGALCDAIETFEKNKTK
ncbi:MAG: SUF system NifU family Fe-S cluster assembly protein [Candidatus Pacebacteria bacterium]|nr:SUF system NifU family Fe-S cluster assembly protein [Candidatus Paceibacterota bacterium]